MITWRSQGTVFGDSWRQGWRQRTTPCLWLSPHCLAYFPEKGPDRSTKHSVRSRLFYLAMVSTFGYNTQTPFHLSVYIIPVSYPWAFRS